MQKALKGDLRAFAPLIMAMTGVAVIFVLTLVRVPPFQIGGWARIWILGTCSLFWAGFGYSLFELISLHRELARLEVKELHRVAREQKAERYKAANVDEIVEWFERVDPAKKQGNQNEGGQS
ncbi:MAG TPA: hypothetical protein VKR31_03090 [Rhizomicrobium sp.]|nr:hypothetical protein [Rhizomicrobium sp.]